MAVPRPADPVLLVVAAFSRHVAVLDWAAQRLESAFGPVALARLTFPFTQTAYYEPTMGPDLRKRLFAFRDLVAADSLAEIKLLTNALEAEVPGAFGEPRPLNLDPGLLTLGKFMLATVKDQAHRIYLGKGIFAEVTLRYQADTFTPWPWTYADYRLPNVVAFLNEARALYRGQVRGRAR
jgi:hypothetical protein